WGPMVRRAGGAKWPRGQIGKGPNDSGFDPRCGLRDLDGKKKNAEIAEELEGRGAALGRTELAGYRALTVRGAGVVMGGLGARGACWCILRARWLDQSVTARSGAAAVAGWLRRMS